MALKEFALRPGCLPPGALQLIEEHGLAEDRYPFFEGHARVFAIALAASPAGRYTSPFSTASPPMRTPVIHELIFFIDFVLALYMWVLIAAAIFSWLIAFNVVNTRHPFVRSLAEFFYRVTEPFIRPIRRYVPNTGGIDLAFLVFVLIIIFIRVVVLPNIDHAFP
jgi:YggT family protein